MATGPVCSIRASSTRAPNWQKVFGRLDDVPITSWLPVLAQVADRPPELIHVLDMKRVTPEERARLVQHICDEFHAQPTEVIEQIDARGLPLLAADLFVAIPLRLLI